MLLMVGPYRSTSSLRAKRSNPSRSKGPIMEASERAASLDPVKNANLLVGSQLDRLATTV